MKVYCGISNCHVVKRDMDLIPRQQLHKIKAQDELDIVSFMNQRTREINGQFVGENITEDYCYA